MPRVSLKKYKLFAFIVESDSEPFPEDMKFIKICWKALIKEKGCLQLNQITNKKLTDKQLESLLFQFVNLIKTGKIKLKTKDETIKVDIEKIKKKLKKKNRRKTCQK